MHTRTSTNHGWKWMLLAVFPMAALAIASWSAVTVEPQHETTSQVSGNPEATVQASDPEFDPGELHFPNGKGIPVHPFKPLQYEIPGTSTHVTLQRLVPDISGSFPNGSSFEQRNINITVDGPNGMRRQLLEVVADYGALSVFPVAVLSNFFEDDVPDLFIPIESGMRFVNFGILRWDRDAFKYVPVQGRNSAQIRINGRRYRTALLVNPESQDGWVKETASDGFYRWFVTCSRMGRKNSIDLIFEIRYEVVSPPQDPGDVKLQLSVHRPSRRAGPDLQEIISIDEGRLGSESSYLGCAELDKAVTNLLKSTGKLGARVT